MAAKRWYILHVYSGYENKVKNDLEHRIETLGVADKVVDIKIPTEELTEVKEGGQRVIKESKVLPGYVLVKMEMDDHTWSVVRNTPGVTGFVGVDGKAVPLTRAEFDKIMHSGEPGETPARTSISLEIGQAVKVTSGPLEGFDGTVSEVSPETGKVCVMVTIFGRKTPVDLTLEQIASI